MESGSEFGKSNYSKIRRLSKSSSSSSSDEGTSDSMQQCAAIFGEGEHSRDELKIQRRYKFNEHNVELHEAFDNIDEFIRAANTDILNSHKSANLTEYVETQRNIRADVDIVVDTDLHSKALPDEFRDFDKVFEDPGLIYKGPAMKCTFSEKHKHVILLKIEHLFNVLGEDLANGRKLTFAHRSCREWNNVWMQEERITIKPPGKAKITSINKSRKNSLQKFKIMCYILRKIYNMVKINATCTKREIYYLMKKYVKSQTQVNDAINAVSNILQFPTWDLHILTTSKGLVYGNFQMTFESGETLDFATPGGRLIPQDIRSLVRIESKVHFILIVEKDSIFQKLMDEGAADRLIRPFILITGKGYADTTTRWFIKSLWKLLSIPVFALVDADPHGIEIMCSYRFGSLACSFNSDELAIPNIRWLGVLPSEINILNVEHLPLTNRDKNKIQSLLKRPFIESNKDIKEQLELMLRRDIKAGIEGVIKSHNYLSKTYLPNKLIAKNYI